MKSRSLLWLALLTLAACDSAQLAAPATPRQSVLGILPPGTNGEAAFNFDAEVQALYQRTNTIGVWGNGSFSFQEMDYRTSSDANEFLSLIFFNDAVQTVAQVNALLDQYIAVITAQFNRNSVKGAGARWVTQCAYLDLTARATWLKLVAIARTTGQPDPAAPSFNCIEQLDPTPNAAPTGVVAVQQGSSVKVTWTDNATNEGCYRVSRSNPLTGIVDRTILPANTTQYIDTSPVVGTTYIYFVAACGNPNVPTLKLSAEASAVITVTPPPPAAPAPPSNLNAVLGTSGITVTWNDNSNNELAFVLKVLLDGTLVSTHTLPANTTSFLVASPVAGTYTFQLQATNAIGASATISKDLVVLPCNPHDNRNGDKCRPKPDPNPDKGKGKK